MRYAQITLPQFFTFSASHLPIFLAYPATRNQKTDIRGQMTDEYVVLKSPCAKHDALCAPSGA